MVVVEAGEIRPTHDDDGCARVVGHKLASLNEPLNHMWFELQVACDLFDR